MSVFFRSVLIPLCSIIAFGPLFGQDPMRFEGQVKELLSVPKAPEAGHIIFTGSSSIRMWKTLAEDYNTHHVVNKGFGGSQMSDLLHYINELVLESNPCQVFIYEGDNDLNAGKSVSEIMDDTRQVVTKLRESSSIASVILIAAKPSVARWKLKAEYEKLNLAYSKFAEQDDLVKFVDIWTPALDQTGSVVTDIFLEDNLHMNEKGYEIWKSAMAPFLSECALKK